MPDGNKTINIDIDRAVHPSIELELEASLNVIEGTVVVIRSSARIHKRICRQRSRERCIRRIIRITGNGSTRICKRLRLDYDIVICPDLSHALRSGSKESKCAKRGQEE